jgi:hypothetical protein
VRAEFKKVKKKSARSIDEARGTRRKYEALKLMTQSNGCTAAEAASAAAAAARLLGRNPALERPDLVRRVFRGFQEDILRAGAKWEYRKCGKVTCHCSKGGRGHGPYLYEKRRDGEKVSSVYHGK